MQMSVTQLSHSYLVISTSGNHIIDHIKFERILCDEMKKNECIMPTFI